MTIASAVVGGFAFYMAAKDFKREQIEMTSARHVLTPLFMAERDREWVIYLLIQQIVVKMWMIIILNIFIFQVFKTIET